MQLRTLNSGHLLDDKLAYKFGSPPKVNPKETIESRGKHGFEEWKIKNQKTPYESEVCLGYLEFWVGDG